MECSFHDAPDRQRAVLLIFDIFDAVVSSEGLRRRPANEAGAKVVRGSPPALPRNHRLNLNFCFNGAEIRTNIPKKINIEIVRYRDRLNR
jgi:hypothetical protein